MKYRRLVWIGVAAAVSLIIYFILVSGGARPIAPAVPVLPAVETSPVLPKPLPASSVAKSVAKSVGTAFQPNEVLPSSDQKIEQWATDLAHSNNPDDLALAAAFNKSWTDEKERLLTQALAIDPDNLLTNHVLVEFCLYQKMANICSIDAINKLRDLDPNNAFADMFSVLQASAFNQPEVALASLKRAASAEFLQTYRHKYISAIGDSLLRNDIALDKAGLEVVFGYEAALASSWGSGISNLTKQYGGEEAWQSTFAELGKLMTNRKNDTLSFAIGNTLLKKYGRDDLEIINRDIELQNLEADLVATGDKASTLWEAGQWELSANQWQVYAKILESSGELEAMQYMNSLISEQTR